MTKILKVFIKDTKFVLQTLLISLSVPGVLIGKGKSLETKVTGSRNIILWSEIGKNGKKLRQFFNSYD